MPSGSVASTSMRPRRATSVAAGRLPMNENRPHRPPWSTDSSRKPGSSPTTRRNAETGVDRSARSSRHSGTTVWSRASERNSSLLGRSIWSLEGAEETGALAGVAGAPPFLLDREEHGVAVAVVVRLPHPLPVARGLALAPVFLAGAAPEPAPPGGKRAAQGLLVHPGELEHLAGPVLLDDRGHQAVGVERDLAQIVLVDPNRRGGGHSSIVGASEVKPGAALDAFGGHGVDVPLAQDQVFLASDFDLVAVLRVEQHAVAWLDISNVRAYSNDLGPDQALRQLGRGWDQDPATGLALAVGPRDLHEQPVRLHLDGLLGVLGGHELESSVRCGGTCT